MDRIPNKISILVVKYGFILLGSLLTALGLEVFFKAHNLIGGGVIGTAVVISYLGELPLSFTLLVLNFPFLLFGYKRVGRGLILPTVFAMLALVYWMSVFRSAVPDPHDILQSTILGGICLGVGSGLVLRYGGYVDGLEFQRKNDDIQADKPLNSRYILLNLVILCVSGAVFGWESAIYSLIAYLVVFKAIDITLELFYKTGRAIIVSSHIDDVAQRIFDRMGKRITYMDGGQTHRQNRRIICHDISSYEVGVLKSIVHDVDENASVVLARDRVI